MSIPGTFEPGISIVILRSLTHFAWEACLLAAAAAGALRLPGISASCRYAILVLALLAMPVCLGVTGFVVARGSDSPAIVAVRTSEPAPVIAATPRALEPRSAANAGEGIKDPPNRESVITPLPAETRRDARVPPPAAGAEAWCPMVPPIKPMVEGAHPVRWGARLAPGIVAIYFCGVLVMLARLCLGIFSSASLRADSRAVTESALRDAFARQIAVSGIGFVPALLFCEQVFAPAVVGILKPAVLLPVSICAEMSIAQIELLLAHELAHIRRCDQFVDLLQRMIEALFFFHPAVWYVSRAIRIEREKCCDDIVIRQGQSRLSYAAALVRVAELNSRAALLGLRPPALGQSAGGKPSQLRLRILRVIGLGSPKEIYPSRAALLAALGTALGMALFGMHLLGVSRAQTPGQAPGTAAAVTAAQPSPYRIVYENGVTAELISVSMVPSHGKPSWEPGGLRLVDLPYKSRFGGNHGDDKQSAYEMTVRLTGVKDHRMFTETRGPDGTLYHGAEMQDDLRVFDCYVPKGNELLDYDLGIAANTWQLRRAFKDPGVYGQGPDKVTVTAAAPREIKMKPDLQFRVTLAPSENALRLVAVDDTGATHLSEGGWSMGREEHTLYAVFPGLPHGRVREYRVETCAYEWKSFKSIHLKPPGGWQAAMARTRAARLMAQELRFKPAADTARIDDAIEKIVRLKVFDDADVWIGAIRDLSEIGPPAVPAIVAELQHTSLPYARSGLAIALRAIGDPRAVPGLVEALANCPFAPNDYGGGRTKDPALLQFMLGLQTGARKEFNFARPVNEITTSLEWLTDHSEGYRPSEKNERGAYQDAAVRWRKWLEQNKSQFLEGLPVLRISGNPGDKPIAPRLADPRHLAADLKADPGLAKRTVLDRWTLLHLAVASDNDPDALARVLIDGGADVNAAGMGGWTPLHLAAALGRRDIVQLLLDHHADASARAEDGCTPLLAAAGACTSPFYTPLPEPDLAVVKLLLDNGSDVKATDARRRTALHGAAAGTDPAVVRLLLDRGGRIDARDDRDRTPLHRAVECDREKVVDVLLAAGADVNARDASGRTPFQLSSYSRYYPAFNPPVVRKLLDHGAEVDLSTTIALGSVEQVAAAIKRDPAAVKEPAKPGEDRSVLQWAISRQSPEMVKLVLDAGADPNAKDKSGNTPLHDAAQAGDRQTLTLLLAARADVNAMGQGSCLPIYWACSRLDVEMVDQLLAAGAKPSGSIPEGPDPLRAALQEDREGRFSQGTPQDRIQRAKTIVTALLNRGVDVNNRQWANGMTPIFSADGDLAELLLERGAKLDATDDDGNTPLHYAAILSRLELLHFLLRHNVALEAKNKKGETPLHCAVGYFTPKGDLLKSLLDAGADVSARDAAGKTPLHRAVQQGSEDSVTALLEKKADPQARDNEGATPLHIAAELGRDELIVVLLKHGASIDAPDSAGRTPLQWATKQKTRDLLVVHGATAGPAR